MSLTEKQDLAVKEASARLVSRAANARGLGIDDIAQRVTLSVEKYLIKVGNAASVDIGLFVDDIHADDLCLIVACERGDENAWGDLVTAYDPVVRSAARKFTSGAEDADDLASSIWAELYGLKQDAAGVRKTKLAYYSGRGSLGGWLRAIISQMAVDRFRKGSRMVRIEEAREFENLAEESSQNSNNAALVSHAQDPEEIFSKDQASGDVAAALSEAIAALDAEDRLVLKMYYFDDLKLKDIANVFGYHEATASRKLVRVQNDIRKSVEKCLRSKHGWSDGEVKRYLTETATELGLSLEKLFAVIMLAALMQDFVIKNVL